MPIESLSYYRFRNEIPTQGYTWTEEWKPIPPAQGGAFLRPCPCMARMADVLPDGDHSVRSEFPLRTKPGLHRTFAKLSDDPAAFLAFANEHGWLMATTPVMYTPKVKVISVVPLLLWSNELLDMKIALHFWDCTKAHNRKELRKYILWAKDFYGVRFSIGVSREGFHALPDGVVTKELPSMTLPRGQWLVHSKQEQAEMQQFAQKGSWGKDDLFSPAKLAILKLVNARLANNCHPQMYLSADENPVGLLTPTNLLGCLWLQLYQEVTGREKLRQCAICQEIMDISDNSSNKVVHDTCSKRERQRRYREKLREIRKTPDRGQ